MTKQVESTDRECKTRYLGRALAPLAASRYPDSEKYVISNALSLGIMPSGGSKLYAPPKALAKQALKRFRENRFQCELKSS